MARILVKRNHSKSPAASRKSVERVALLLAEKFQVDYRWEGDSLHFQRMGVEGAIHLLPGLVEVVAELGFLFGALRGTVESEIEKYLDKEFGKHR